MSPSTGLPNHIIEYTNTTHISVSMEYCQCSIQKYYRIFLQHCLKHWNNFTVSSFLLHNVCNILLQYYWNIAVDLCHNIAHRLWTIYVVRLVMKTQISIFYEGSVWFLIIKICSIGYLYFKSEKLGSIESLAIVCVCFFFSFLLVLSK